ncbi:hypothetical protein Ddc_06966 [Ditylenchus destructor]|nr:hypothetical protein Ddc_06966 [Ditylenchus destructor]
MAAESAKNALESAFNKTKEVLNSAAESTKGLANQAFENVSKIIPGQGNSGANANNVAGDATNPSAVTTDGQPPVVQ